MANTYLIGCHHSEGSFINKETGEEISFDNVILSVISDDQVERGFRAFDVKIKYDDYVAITGLSYPATLQLLDSFVAQPSYRFYPIDLQYVLDRSGRAKLVCVKITRPVTANNAKSV